MACIRKRRDRWVIDFYDNRGIRRWKTLPKGATKTKARESMRDIEDDVKRGIYLPDEKIPLFSKVGENWLLQKKQNVRASTVVMYERHLKLHFNEINSLKINKITIAKVEKFIAKRQNEGMNLTTLRKLIVTFNQVMKYAVRHRYIDYNPVRDAERPRNQGEDREEKIWILTPSEISAFLDAVSDQKYRTLFMLAIMSGARQGELLGLKWSEIDWENNQIRIRRTFNCGKWYQPKSKASVREIDLGPKVMLALKKWKLACPKTDLVFPTKNGNPIDPNNLLRCYFHPALREAGIRKIRFHDLRHTYASLMIEQGENLKYIQKQLGHANPTVTLNVYAHLMKSVNQEAACRLENTIFKKDGSKTVAETDFNEMGGIAGCV